MVRHTRACVGVQTPQEAQRVSLEVPQPKAAELYYSLCARIGQRNRCRQDDLQLERKYVTSWPIRVNMTLLRNNHCGLLVTLPWTVALLQACRAISTRS
jgi:hypothetical protein